jgi:hypothetical protein
MKTKNVSQIKLTDSQLKSVQEYCKLNNIEDVDNFITKCYIDGYNIQKYGLLGDDLEKIGGIEEKQVEIEVIKEIRVEVPVEVIKEVVKEVIKEVPVETIKEIDVIKYVDREVIKEVRVEVPVPNLDNICDKPESNNKIKLLQETLQKLRKELTEKNSKIIELEEINKQLESIKVSQGAVFLKGSNISETM